MFGFGLFSTSATASKWNIIIRALSGMDFCRCQPPCYHLIMSDNQHGKCIRCLGLAHAQDAIFGISNCKCCENLTLKNLHTRLAVFDCESARSLPPSYSGLIPLASSLCEAATYSSDAELEAMDSEQFPLSIARSSLCGFSSLVSSRLSCARTGSSFLRDGGCFVYRGLQLQEYQRRVAGHSAGMALPAYNRAGGRFRI